MHALRHYLRVRFAMLPVLEAMVLFQSMVVGVELSSAEGGKADASLHGAAFAAMMLFVMTALGLYEKQRDPFRLTVQRLLSAYLVTLLVFAATSSLILHSSVGRDTFAVASLFALFGLLVVRYSAYRASGFPLPAARVLVVGEAPASTEVAKVLSVPREGRAARFQGEVSIQGAADAAAPGAMTCAVGLAGIVRQLRIS
jgi:hypothetical protein